MLNAYRDSLASVSAAQRSRNSSQLFGSGSSPRCCWNRSVRMNGTPDWIGLGTGNP